MARKRRTTHHRRGGSRRGRTYHRPGAVAKFKRALPDIVTVGSILAPLALPNTYGQSALQAATDSSVPASGRGEGIVTGAVNSYKQDVALVAGGVLAGWALRKVLRGR